MNLLKDEKLVTTIAAPFKLFTSSLSNNKSNKKRNGWVVAGRAADSTHVPGRHKRQRMDSTSTAGDRDTFSPGVMEDIMEHVAPTVFNSACRPFEILVSSLVTDTNSATKYTRTDSAQPDGENTTTISDSINTDTTGTAELTTKFTNEKDNDEEIKPTIETKEDGVMIGHQNLSKPDQATNGIGIPHSPPLSLDTTPSISPPPPAWYLVTRSAAAASAPTAITITPSRSLHVSPSPRFDRGSFTQHATTDEVLSAAEMMMLLRSSAHLPMVNRGR